MTDTAMDESKYLHSSPNDVVVSGIAGSFPNSDSVKELMENLFNKVDLIDDDDRRWNLNHPEIPQRTGKIRNITKFDAEFFDKHFREAHRMDPSCRILLEKAYEAIIDAGVNPSELRGSRTGVFIGSCFSESEKTWFYEKVKISEFGMTGCSPAMQANRLSYWLGVEGPSYVVDTACSSSLYALEHAYKAIRDGDCDAALVGCVNLCLHPNTSQQFFRLGVLSPDGRCKCFDQDADGYTRSEAIVVCFLQKVKDARRVHTQIVHAKTNCDGYKQQGISFPSGPVQKVLLQDFYQEVGIPPQSLEYVEAHVTGTFVGDPEEMVAIDEIFCTGRSEPLLLGGIKSNLGHSEPSSGLCSLAKLCIAYNTGYIPPNINFKKPRDTIKALIEGRATVVTEKRPWTRGLSGINGFGFGGANAHLLLKKASRNKMNNGLPNDVLPRLVCVSGVSISAVDKIFDELESRTVDVEEIRLWHAIHEMDVQGHHARGFVLLGSTPSRSVRLARHVQEVPRARRSTWLVYSGLDAPPLTLAADLMKLPVFEQSIRKCQKVLEGEGIDLISLLTEPRAGAAPGQPGPHALVVTTAVHIALTDLLRAVGIQTDYIMGCDAGELGCAYAEGALGAEQALRAARGAGARDAGHLRARLSDVTPPPHARSPRWVTHPDNELASESVQIPPDAVIIATAPLSGQGVWSRTLQTQSDVEPITLLGAGENNLQGLLTALGKLFEQGLNPRLASLYPTVEFPVSQSTPLLSHLVEWRHSEDWFVPSFKLLEKISTSERSVKISMQDDNYAYVSGHVIDGRVILPGTGYLVLVWETLAMMKGRLYTQTSVVFEHVSLQRLTYMPADGAIELVISVHKKSGEFEIVENATTIAKGRAYLKDNVGETFRVIREAEGDENSEKSDGEVLLNNKDFYKELHLRGYNYKGIFRGIMSRNVAGTRGKLAWFGNWVSFLDNLLQLRVHDSRALNVPVRIDQLSIDVDLHDRVLAKAAGEERQLEFRTYQDIGIVRCGGAELRGVHMAAIPKKLPVGIPVFEKHEFIPNFKNINKLKVEDILRVDLQIILENVQTYKFKSIELVDEEYQKNGLQPLMQQVGDVLADMPLVQAELLVLSEAPMELPENIAVENRKISGDTNAIVVIGANLLDRPSVLQQAEGTLKDKCFIISREQSRPNSTDHPDYDIVTIHEVGSEHLVMLRKREQPKPTKFIKINSSDETFAWVEEVKEEMQNGQKLVLYSQDESINGLLGLVNCLRKEPGGESVCALLIADPKAPKFKPDLELFKEHINKDLAVNILKDGSWGTYRHLLLPPLQPTTVEHAYVNTTTIGDLSSLRYLEGSYKHDQIFKDPRYSLIHVYCSALNFRDVMTASGRVAVEAVARGRLAQECVQGLEVAGRTANGTRVMTMCGKGISNMVQGDQDFMWSVPDEWTFEEAVTVPVAYTTVYLALVLVGKIRSGESILVHCGSGGVGQAALSVALHAGCRVFTTVGTPAKRAFIKRLFPQIPDSQIGNSRDTSFENMIRRETNGEGVDLVLNSLADDKLLASTKCLRRRGRFLEIGKYDITNNTIIQMYLFSREISFHGVMLDFIFDDESIKLKKALQQLLVAGIQSGAVRPLTYCTFEKDQIEPAYRYMASGKHIGKVVLKMRADEKPNESVRPKRLPIVALPRYTCDEEGVWVVVGGLGGFGLELADWLVLRGARSLLLTSRRGVSNGYQALRLSTWASYGVTVKISTHDVTTDSGCEEMLKMANSMGAVRAVFNLAVVLKDAVFQNQTPEMFRTSFAPKGLATMHLDKLTRKMCPDLRDFVIFSSVSCGRGNAGQTNYGFSNSVMERICEERQRVGLPALAVQWGAIGDVGLVADMQEENVQLEIGGTLQQRIACCLQALDRFLTQRAAVVSSIVVAEKKVVGAGDGNLVGAVAQILGIVDLKTVSQQAPLAEFGLDSIVAVEIKQTLERDFEIFLTAQEIRMLTFAKLNELSAQGAPVSSAPSSTAPAAGAGLNVLIRNFGDEATASEPFIEMPSKVEDESAHALFLLPGLESAAEVLRVLCGRLRARTRVLQLGHAQRGDRLERMVDRLYKVVRPSLTPGTPFYLLGYSFGSLVMIKLAARLESEGFRGVVFCLDGSPEFTQKMTSKLINYSNEVELQNSIILHTLQIAAPGSDMINALKDQLKATDSFQERIRCGINACPVKLNYSEEYITGMAHNTCDRIKAISDFDVGSKIKSPIVLMRTAKEIVASGDNYGLENLTESKVTTHVFESDHISIVEHEGCADVINDVLADIGKQTYRTWLKRSLGN